MGVLCVWLYGHARVHVHVRVLLETNT